jgi:hypothetical protein
LLILTTVIVMIVAGLLARQADPLQRITLAARAVERGEFDLQILDPLAHRRSGGERQSGGEIGHLVRVFRDMAAEVERREQLRRLLDVVISIGVALPKEQDFGRLLETVVTEARQLCHADTGALYLRTENDQLEFVILQSGSGQLALGGTTGQRVPFPPIPLYDSGGAPNHEHIASHTVHTNATVNVADIYQIEGNGFSDVKAFDRQIGYHSRSFLSVPLKENADNVIGVLQLTNAQDAKTSQIIAFNPGMNRVIESLAALGTVALRAYMQRAQLQQQIRQLQIEIDLARQDQEVREITGADYFQRLQERANSPPAPSRGSERVGRPGRSEETNERNKAHRFHGIYRTAGFPTSMMNPSNYRWRILILAALTMALTVAVPSMCLPVLFDEISDDLGLSRTQIGMIWGIGALPSILIALVGGSIGDRFGPKRILMAACLLSGAAGALRGLSANFTMLIVTGSVFGLLASMVPMNSLKTCGIWFPRQQLGWRPA